MQICIGKLDQTDFHCEGIELPLKHEKCTGRTQLVRQSNSSIKGYEACSKIYAV